MVVDISIIVPAYNAEKTLGECLNSLLRQDCDNYEVLVVDDGSEDNTRAVVESVGDERLVYVRQSNGGVSAARNTGISRAQGEYIIFCDADDCVSTRYVRTLMEHADGDALVICNFSKKREALDTENMEMASAEFNYLRSPESLAQLQERYYHATSVCMLFRKSVIQRNGLRFDPNLCLGEDTKFVYEYLFSVKRIIYVNQILYFYNRKNSTLSISISERRVDSLLSMADFLFESIRKGRLAGAPVITHCYQYIAVHYVSLSASAYAFLPYSQARALQVKMRAHPFVRLCIENCQWGRTNSYPGRGAVMKFFARQNIGALWRVAGCLKKWKNYVAR